MTPLADAITPSATPMQRMAITLSSLRRTQFTLDRPTHHPGLGIPCVDLADLLESSQGLLEPSMLDELKALIGKYVDIFFYHVVIQEISVQTCLGPREFRRS